MLEELDHRRIDTSEVTIDLAVGGSGPPLLLLHGYPQTRAMWHAVAPDLAAERTVVAPDLRGYGDSDKPPGDASHAGYAKRAMAADGVEVMEALGFDRFDVVGHDRGGRVAERMALDHPERVRSLAVLDIVPARRMFDSLTSGLAHAYFHWFFLAQPFDLPERMIGADPGGWVEDRLAAWSAEGFEFAPEAVAEYRRGFSTPEAIHAGCEDYRAGASIDLEHDAADGGRRIGCPLLALWGEDGAIAAMFDVAGTWRERGEDVRARAVSGAHFPAEEAPRETLAELRAFLQDEG